MSDPTEPNPVAHLVVSPAPTPLAIYQQALEKGISVEQLGKLLDLHERHEKNEAAKIFATAVSGFQAECPMVFKGRTVKTRVGGDMYKFASYDDIKRVTRTLEAKYGISTSFDIKEEAAQQSAKLVGTCRVRVGNYYEDHTFTMPIPKGLNTNAAQDYGMALSYLKRYLYCAALDIVVTDEDDDGQSCVEFVTPDEIAVLNDLFQATDTNLAKFLDWASEASGLKCETLDKVPQRLFVVALTMLRKKEKK